MTSADEPNAGLLEQVWYGPLAREAAAALTSLPQRRQLQAELDGRIAEVRAEYESRMPSPTDAVRAYNQARVQLLLRRLAERDQMVCLMCYRVQPTDDFRLVILDGVAVQQTASDCSYRRPQPYLEPYLTLRRLCSRCREECERPPVPVDLPRATGVTYCRVRSARQEDQTVWAEFDGQWRLVTDQITGRDPELNLESSSCVGAGLAELAAAMGVPPELRYNGGGHIFAPTCYGENGIAIPPPPAEV